MLRATRWVCRDRFLSLEEPLIMGIVNATPDSFSDGGLHVGARGAIEWGLRLMEQGADILDVGGESTRPGAPEVSLDEELDRVIPVVDSLVRAGAVVSVDTSKSQVMREALKVGAHILNDVRSFTLPGAQEVAVNSDAGLVLMHMQGTPATMQRCVSYENDDVTASAIRFLQERDDALTTAGVNPNRICWDCGFGFGKTVEQNFELLAQTERFVQCGRPYLMGLSRKSSIGAVTGVKEPQDRVVGSVVGALLAAQRGAQVLRVHDVARTKEGLAVWHATQKAGLTPKMK